MHIHAYVSSSARCLTATLWLRPLVRTHLYNKREQIQSPYYLFVLVPPRWTIRVGGRAHITRERQSEFIPISTRKSNRNRRPPSWRTHSITTRVGPGGNTPTPVGSCDQAGPSPRVGPWHVKGSFALGLRATLCQPPGLNTPIRVKRSWRKCVRYRRPWVPVLK